MTENNEPVNGFTRLPHVFFDILPTLTDSETRVLLIVLRSTLGWQEGSNNGGTQTKRRDWISHSQLQRRTGRSSASVSAAVHSLVTRSLIVVENERGGPLMTPEDRRLNMGKLYYRPVDMWIKGVDMCTTTRNPDIGKPLFTKENWNNKYREEIKKTLATMPPVERRSGLERVSTILEQQD